MSRTKMNSGMMLALLALTSCNNDASPTNRSISSPAQKVPHTDSTPDTTAPRFTSEAYTTPASPSWSVTPTVTLSVSETASVTIFSDGVCESAISDPTSVSSGAGQTVKAKSIPVATTTTIYGKAVDAAGNASACTIMASYTQVMRFKNPYPSYNDGFGSKIVELTNGNMVITAPNADINGIIDAGAVYLFNGKTGALISAIYGSTASDNVGSGNVKALTNGNFVVASPNWDCTAALCPYPAASAVVSNVGAVTWGSGTIGVAGPVSSLNSLVGSTSADQVGSGTILPLTNGNYVVGSYNWDCSAALCPAPAIAASVANVGAATWGNGTTGISGPVTSLNSLVGSTSNDQVSFLNIIALTNGNYVVSSRNWDCTASLCPTPAIAGAVADVGAATWGNGNTGIAGPVNSTNSLVGSTASDQVGTPLALANGNYVVYAANWDCTAALCPAPAANATVANVGAVTWADGTTGRSGPINSSISLVGSTASDQIANNGVYALTNGNYVVASYTWDCTAALCPAPAVNATVTDVGAVTWGSGTVGIAGPVNSANSLIGSTTADNVGNPGINILTNGNYVVRSINWDCTASLCPSPAVAATVTDVGAVTWSSGTSPKVGPVTSLNSLVGTTAFDNVGSTTVVPLTNGNYVVASQNWDCTVAFCPAPAAAAAVVNVGAVTWGSGTSGITGPVNSTNSLVGSTANDLVGTSNVTALSNGNYVVATATWDCTAALCPAPAAAATVANVGAVTWGSGTAGIVGPVSSLNSLVGSTASDSVGSTGVRPLTNGNYVVMSSIWDCTALLCPYPAIAATIGDVGAVTWGSGTAGIAGPVTSLNSLVGSSTTDNVGSVTTLTNGNYVVTTYGWNCAAAMGCPYTESVDVGAITWGSGTVGVSGPLTQLNSIIGNFVNDKLGSNVVATADGAYIVRNDYWGIFDPGIVFKADGTQPTTGVLSEY